MGKTEKPWISEDRLTLTAMLKQHGYQTHMIGKWHLGWDWPQKNSPTQTITPKKVRTKEEISIALWDNIDLTQPIGKAPDIVVAPYPSDHRAVVATFTLDKASGSEKSDAKNETK